ncbi:hypothetical protein NLG97_g186 [Lecanicillium saksenae]|uniref:Uncharacterized protein n=1 Tax=Lecanicillium saksenae TaxID=468837 RepID=A0ACC1R973_9HYPO|nr:hypothetical protein NLG97_g186 [Lecanicillium saksenae]
MENSSTPLVATFEGHISSTLDALLLFEGCLEGILNHVPRRPHDRERQDLIKSGNVFIYEEHASGIKRWTDGVSWSPSRILGNFLIYRELEKPFPPGEKKRALKKTKKSPQGISKPEPISQANMSYLAAAGVDPASVNKDQERSLIGSLVDSYPFKPEGLVKKTISICYQGVPHHLVSYYNVDDVVSGKLQTPTSVLGLQNITPRTELFLSQNFRTPVDEVEYAVADHNGALAAQYAPNHGSFNNGSGVLHRAIMQGNLQNAMNTSHQSSSPSGYLFPQHSGGSQNSYPGPIPSQPFPDAMGQQMPYAPNPTNNYSLDPTRSDRFASTATVNHEFPRNMPSATSSRRASIYDVGSHQSDISNMSYGSNGTESRPMANNAYLAQQSYYMPQQRQSVASMPHTSTFPVARGLRAESDSIPADNVSHQYNLDDTSPVWNFEGLEGNSEQQYFAGHTQNHVQWSNGPNSLHRT